MQKNIKNDSIRKNIEISKICPAELNEKYGYINKNGKWILKPQFEEASKLSEGRAAVELNGKYGFIDSNGKYVVYPKYQFCCDFSEGLAAYRTKGKYGFINRSGKVVISPKFEIAQDFSEGLAAVADSNMRYGYINQKGKYVIRPSFEYANRFSEGLAGVVYPSALTLGTTAYINKKGKITIYVTKYFEDKNMFSGTDFSEDVAFIKSMCNKQLKWILIDKSGHKIGKLYFDEVRNFIGGKAFVKINSKWEVINKKGNVIKQLPYDFIGNYSENLAVFEDNNRWGYIDKNINEVIKPKFYGALDFTNGFAFAIISKDSKCGYINKNGKLIWHD